jgi:hypothetical protein
VRAPPLQIHLIHRFAPLVEERAWSAESRAVRKNVVY